MAAGDEDCPLAKAIRSGLHDDIMFRLLKRMAKIPWPVEEDHLHLKQPPRRRRHHRGPIGEPHVSMYHWWQICMWMTTGGVVGQHGRPMDAKTADYVYTVLVQECGAVDHYLHRENFVARWPECREYRFGGALGFGGKVWFNPTEPGKQVYVTCYREDETPERLAMISKANTRLMEIKVKT